MKPVWKLLVAFMLGLIAIGLGLSPWPAAVGSILGSILFDLEEIKRKIGGER